MFWTLMPLAVNSMAQPGRRICGLPNRYRTYLRCSPLLCAADSVSIIMRLAVSTTYHCQSFSEAVGMLLHERFNSDDLAEEFLEAVRKRFSDDDLAEDRSDQPLPLEELGLRLDDDLSGDSVDLRSDDDQAESVPSLEKMTWLRWLWFTLGTLPSAIKLMSMKGVPWEQAWGMMFLSSWVLNEGLIIFASLNQAFFTKSPSGQISWPGFEQETLSPAYKKARLAMSLFERYLAYWSLIFHGLMMNTAFMLFLPLGRSYRQSATVAPHELAPLLSYRL
jgi:hypothetical protein